MITLKVPAGMTAIAGLLLNIVALAQAPIVPSAPVPSVPVQGIMQAVQPVPLDPLATLKLLAVCTCQEPSGPYQVGSVSATAVTLADGQQWRVDGNTIVRSGMTLSSLANLRQGQWVIVEGTVAIDGHQSLYAVVIEAFDYAVTLTGYANPANPLTLSGPSGSVSAYFGPWTTWMDFTGIRLNQASMRGSLQPGTQLLAAVRTGSDGRPYVVAMAVK